MRLVNGPNSEIHEQLQTMKHQDHIQSWNICIIIYNCSHIRLPYQEKFPLMADSYILMAYEMAMNLCQNFMRCTTSGPSRWPPSSQFRRSANHSRVVCCARCAGNGFWKILFQNVKTKEMMLLISAFVSLKTVALAMTLLLFFTSPGSQRSLVPFWYHMALRFLMLQASHACDS